jgi:hypothetical protein
MTHYQNNPFPTGYSLEQKRANGRSFHSDSDISGIRSMWAAVILGAFVEMNKKDARKAAGLWVFSQSTKIGSMRWICDMCGFDYHKLCHLAMTREGRRRIIHGR